MKRKINYNSSIASIEIADALQDFFTEDTIFVCIGTDKCIGDSLGPLIGSLLEDNFFDFPVYGTLRKPIHALNIEKNIIEIKKKHPDSNIIGIDACLGNIDSIGEIHVRDYSIQPGKGVGKSLPSIGNASIIGIVDSSEHMEFFATRSIRLSLIFDMAKAIVKALELVSLDIKKNNTPIS